MSEYRSLCYSPSELSFMRIGLPQFSRIAGFPHHFSRQISVIDNNKQIAYHNI